ncbi:MAG: hypothetical protein RLZ13_493 [Bacteroidota bacterium]
MSLEILVMTLLVLPSYTTSPTFPTKLAVVKGLTPEQQAPLPGWEPMPIVTGIFFEPVPLILKLTRSALAVIRSVSDDTKEEENTTLAATKKATKKRKVFFIDKRF